MGVITHWLEADELPRCQHCPHLADERSFMCEECSGKADEEADSLREQLRGAVEAFDALEWNAYDGFDSESSVLISRESFERLRRAIHGGQ